MKMQRFALIGYDISYSLSPRIFAAIFAQAGQQGRFELHSVPPGTLKGYLQAQLNYTITGFAVTIPHKEAIVEHMHHLDAVARATGAVNSVVVREGSLFGYNTDCYGFTYALKRTGISGFSRALILGCGGGARAILCALRSDCAVRHFTVWGRSTQKLETFRQHFRRELPDIDVTCITDLTTFAGDREGLLIVNCTPLGGPNHINSNPLPLNEDWGNAALYVDLNYNSDNRIIAALRDAGVATADGSVMLVAQALRSYKLWTGIDVEFDSVYTQVFQDE
ncbi:MAG: shikimate dehydrogenase [Candidatus Zixiibacteriota bacterium]